MGRLVLSQTFLDPIICLTVHRALIPFSYQRTVGLLLAPFREGTRGERASNSALWGIWHPSRGAFPLAVMRGFTGSLPMLDTYKRS